MDSIEKYGDYQNFFETNFLLTLTILKKEKKLKKRFFLFCWCDFFGCYCISKQQGYCTRAEHH